MVLSYPSGVVFLAAQMQPMLLAAQTLLQEQALEPGLQ
jgi:hypothetical protein